MMPISQFTTRLFIEGFEFWWVLIGMKYQGIFLNLGLSNIVEDNLLPLLTKTVSNFDRWADLQLSLLGRVLRVKMVIVPRYNYIFGMIPIQSPKKLLAQINSFIKSFIWGSSRPRLKVDKLYAHTELEGMRLPHMSSYYTAHHLSQLIH